MKAKFHAQKLLWATVRTVILSSLIFAQVSFGKTNVSYQETEWIELSEGTLTCDNANGDEHGTVYCRKASADNVLVFSNLKLSLVSITKVDSDGIETDPIRKVRIIVYPKNCDFYTKCSSAKFFAGNVNEGGQRTYGYYRIDVSSINRNSAHIVVYLGRQGRRPPDGEPRPRRGDNRDR